MEDRCLDPYTWPSAVTPADVGRRIAALRTVDWQWRYIPFAVVAAVQPCFVPAAVLVQVEIGGRVVGWFSQEDVRLW